MRIRRILLDVDKAVQRPDLLELAEAIDGVTGVDAINITVAEIDIQTVGMEITVEGEDIDVPTLLETIERAGAAVHGVDEVVAGTRLVERVARHR